MLAGLRQCRIVAMNCSNCGAPLRLPGTGDYLFCDHCETRVFPEPDADGVSVLGGETALNCPACRTPLTHAAVAGVRVYFCPACRGLLTDVDEFVAIVGELRPKYADERERPRPIQSQELERAVDCPRCRRRMDTHPYGGPGNIVIDNCPDCRLNWLDHRELRRVVRAPGAWL
jgi:Zn-finger nucleic acid-binding protein